MTDTPHDMAAIEAEVERTMTQGLATQLRPRIVSKQAEADAEKLRDAMRNVDRAGDRVRFSLEAYIDQAIHTRIVEMRGSYSPGPRDSWVRRHMLEALLSISNDNGNEL
jgi:hypothetical protein